MSQTLPLLLAAGAVFYFYRSSIELPEEVAPERPPPQPVVPESSMPVEDTGATVQSNTTCDEGYIFNSENNTCDPTQALLDSACGKNYRYDKEKDSCVLAGRLGCKAPLYRVDKPTEEDPDNFECVDPTTYTRDESKDILKTGNEKADIAVNVFTNLGAGMVMDMGLQRAGRAISENLLTSQADRAAKELAEKAAKEAAEKAAAEAAEKAAKEAAERLATEAAEKAAKRAAAKTAALAAQSSKAAALATKAGKGASLLTKIKGTPFSFIITIIATILSSVLDLDPSGFEACKPGEFDYSTLPDWAKVIIEAIPFVGDLLMLLGPIMCMGKGCKPDEVEQNGLCYPPPLPGWWCEAFLCYAQDEAITIDRPGFTNNGMGHTTTHMTKRFESDLGRPRLEVGVCPPGTRKDSAGALCYPNVPDNWNIVWGVAWEGCNADERDDGAFCAKETITPCAEGQWEVARDCWGNRTDYLDDCTLGWDGCKHRWWSHAKCERWGHCPDLLGTNWCAGICDQWGGWECTGGCRSKPVQMPELKTTFAARNWSFSSRPKGSRALAGTERELDCPPGMTKQAGWNETCYDTTKWPPGYQMQTAGLISQICPRVIDASPARQQPEFADFVDIGAGCQRARYSRGIGKPAISMYIKKKKEQPPNVPPPMCSDVANVVSDPNNLLLCRSAGCADDEKINADFSLCEQQCRPLYKDEGQFCTREAGIQDPVTGQIYQTADSYEKRAPREVSYDVY